MWATSLDRQLPRRLALAGALSASLRHAHRASATSAQRQSGATAGHAPRLRRAEP
jgi:hypothetical protein